MEWCLGVNCGTIYMKCLMCWSLWKRGSSVGGFIFDKSHCLKTVQQHHTTPHNNTQQHTTAQLFWKREKYFQQETRGDNDPNISWLGFRFSIMNHKESWNKMVSHKMQSQKGILTYVRWLRLANLTQRNARLDHTLYDYPIHIRDGHNHQNCLSKQ